MPITASYQVQCDVCFGYLDGYFDTRDQAEDARRQAGWDDSGRTACPQHNTSRTAEQ